MPLYEVGVRWSKVRIRIEAKSGTQAKRIWCRMHDRSPSDYWTGMSILSANIVKESKINKID